MSERNERLYQALRDSAPSDSLRAISAAFLANDPEWARAWRDALNEHVKDEMPDPQSGNPTAEIIGLFRKIDALGVPPLRQKERVALRHELRKVMNAAPSGIEIAGTIELANGGRRGATLRSYNAGGGITAWKITYRTAGTLKTPGRWRTVATSGQYASFRVGD